MFRNIVRAFVVLALVALSAGACTKSSTAPSDGIVCSGGTCVPPSQNVIAPTTPATQIVGGQQVTLVNAAIGTITGPGRVLYCQMTTSGGDRFDLGGYILGEDGTQIAAGCSSTPGGFVPLNGLVPIAIVVFSRSDGTSARWDLIH